jgi:hypothetical protein
MKMVQKTHDKDRSGNQRTNNSRSKGGGSNTQYDTRDMHTNARDGSTKTHVKDRSSRLAYHDGETMDPETEIDKQFVSGKTQEEEIEYGDEEWQPGMDG